MLLGLKTILARIDADYSDIRYERIDHTMISLSGQDLTTVSRSTSDGFVTRVLRGVGLASIGGSSETDRDRGIKTVIENAQILGRAAAKPVRLAPSPAIRETVLPSLYEDP